jgi:hypothetical protein
MQEGLAAARKVADGLSRHVRFRGIGSAVSGDVKFERPCGVDRY